MTHQDHNTGALHYAVIHSEPCMTVIKIVDSAVPKIWLQAESFPIAETSFVFYNKLIRQNLGQEYSVEY